MGLLTPEPGLVFWTTLSFLTLLFLLRRFAWKPVLRALKVREEYIEFALNDASKAREDIIKLNEERKEIIEFTRIEREAMIREASEMKEEIINEARGVANAEANKILEHARSQILREREESLSELKQQVSLMSLEIAEKILKQELVNEERQHLVINKYLSNVKFN